MGDLLNFGFNSGINQGQFGQQPRMGSGQVNPGLFQQNGTTIDDWGFNPQSGNVNGQRVGVAGQQDINISTPFNNWQKAGVGIQGASALLSGYLGMKQYGMAKDQLAFQKDSFNKNYNNQKRTYNTNLEDRQRSRIAANPNAQGLDEYMQANRIQ